MAEKDEKKYQEQNLPEDILSGDWVIATSLK